SIQHQSAPAVLWSSWAEKSRPGLALTHSFTRPIGNRTKRCLVTTAVQTIDLTLLTPLLEKYNGRKREALLPLLHQAQDIYGWLPPEVQEAIGKTLRVPLADIHGVVEFYTMLYNEPTARQVIRVCEDLACSKEGSHAVIQAISQATGLEPGETSEDGVLTFETVPCLGMCEHAPCALHGEKPAGSLTPKNVPDFLAGNLPEPSARPRGGPFIKLARI